ncbi:MAG: DUF3187 family protein [Nitrospirae bacterium]|nr:DUF3187 family protein [Nitrospirota bacterium]MBI3594290.1 DUF3187 family protein [Nitrospirota bacterium]
MRYYRVHNLKVWIFIWILAIIHFNRCAWAEQAFEGTGPFPVRNYSPIQLLFLSMPAENATTLPRGLYEVRFEAVESNILLVESTPKINLLLKFETFRSELQLKYGFKKSIELGLEIPFLDRMCGFLDPFIMSVEEGFSNLNANRVKLGISSFGGYLITQNGKTILSGADNETGMGDIVLSGKWGLVAEGLWQPAFAVRGAVKFPTGDFSRAFGSGRSDTGIGLALHKQIYGRWFLYFNQNVVFPGGHFGSTDITLNPIYSTSIACEYLLSSRFSFTAQFDYYSSPFHDTESHILDNGTAEWVLGFNYKTRHQIVWQFYAIENFENPEGSAADFSLVTDLTYRFN